MNHEKKHQSFIETNIIICPDPRNWPAIHDCVLPVVTPNQPCFYMPLWFATVHTRIILSKMVLLQSQFFTRKEIAAEDMCMQPCDFKFPASERGLYQLTSENLPPSTYSYHFSPLLSTSLRFSTSLHFSPLLSTSLHFSPLLSTSLRFSPLLSTSLHPLLSIDLFQNHHPSPP